MTPLWLRAWREVREIYRKAEQQKDRRRAEAEAWGINCKPKRERKEKVPCS